MGYKSPPATLTEEGSPYGGGFICNAGPMFLIGFNLDIGSGVGVETREREKGGGLIKLPASHTQICLPDLCVCAHTHTNTHACAHNCPPYSANLPPPVHNLLGTTHPLPFPGASEAHPKVGNATRGHLVHPSSPAPRASPARIEPTSLGRVRFG